MTGWVSLVDTGQHWVQILFMCTGLTLLYIVGIADDLMRGSLSSEIYSAIDCSLHVSVGGALYQ